MIKISKNNSGFTLIELVLVIVMIGIIFSVAYRSMSSQIETAKFEQTIKEMEQIAYAISGNPTVFDKGHRVDFGYVGDIGALPSNLDALVSNPGLGNWNGPYLATNSGDNSYKKDGWDSFYTYSDTLLRSSGSGSNIDKILIESSSALLQNSLEGYLIDADNSPPGTVKKDSVLIELVYPNGSGGYTVSANYPAEDGYFSISSLPVGNHQLRLVYLPLSDTTSMMVTINPADNSKMRLVYPADIF